MRVVVTTCDAHVHVVEFFIKAWRKAWPNCTWPIEVVAGTICPPCANAELVNVVQLGLDEGWSDNMLIYLNEFYPNGNDPFLLMLEDYIVTEVSADYMELCETAARNPIVGQVRLVPIPGPTLDWEGHDSIGEFDKEEPYAISLQASMWRPEVLQDLLVMDENPWQVETKGSRRAKTYDKYIFLGARGHALKYLNLLRRGEEREDVLEWIHGNLGE